MRSGELERLHRAWGVPLLRVTAVASKNRSPQRDVCGALQNNEVLVLILMNVQRRTVTSVRDDLNDRIRAVRLRSGYSD